MTAIEFFKQHGIKMNVEYFDHDRHFVNDNHTRDIYKVILKRNRKQFSFKWGCAVLNPTAPTEQDILESIRFDVYNTVQEFTNNFGSMGSDKADTELFKKVNREANNYIRLLGDIEDEIINFQNNN